MSEMDKKEIEMELAELESQMQDPNFWQDKDKAQSVIKQISVLKNKQASKNKYDKGDAVLSLFFGAGGDDAEDWCKILFEMYSKYAESKGWNISILNEHKTEHSGLKSISFELSEKSTPTSKQGVYGIMKNEAGVHRLVRISPFSSKSLRHTSFALLEVVPKFVNPSEVEIPDKDLKIEFSRSTGAGGQNVNKRDTAVRIVHLPTKISVHVEAERSQQQNREKAMEMLTAKLYQKKVSQQKIERESLGVIDAENEWGHQIRSYVFHPYRMVKDHRTDVETSDVDGVLEGGLDIFIEAEKDL